MMKWGLSAEENKRFLVEGVDVNALDPLGQNALFYQSIGGIGFVGPNLEAIQVLLDAGIDKNIKDKRGQTIRDEINTCVGSSFEAAEARAYIKFLDLDD